MQEKQDNWNEIVMDMAKTLGASHVGITTKNSLNDSHQTTDLDYILDGAESAVTFAVPFSDKDLDNVVDMYLKKQDHKKLETAKVRATTLANGIALEISGLLNQVGYKTTPVHSNFVYRKESPAEYRVPPLSHKFLAFRGGIGHIGYSGMIITKEYGANIALASVVTQAKLEATNALPESENYCDNCKLCSKVCLGDYMLNDEHEDEIGGVKYKTALKAHPMRCSFVCTGSTGYKGGNWSTWSPARFNIPESDDELNEIFQEQAIPHNMREINSMELKEDFFIHFIRDLK